MKDIGSSSAAKAWGFRLREGIADLRWTLRRAARYLGLPGWIGIFLLMISAWVTLVEIPKAEHERIELQADLGRLQQIRAHPAIGPAQPKPLEVLRVQLETQDRFATVVDDLNGFLSAANVTLVEATLGAPMFKDLPTIGRIDMAVYAKGTYPAIKAAIGKLLDRHPGLGLEQLVLDKSEPTSPVLDAHLRFVYFFKQ